MSRLEFQKKLKIEKYRLRIDEDANLAARSAFRLSNHGEIMQL